MHARSIGLGALVSTLLVGGKAIVKPGLMGTSGGEAYGHAWVQWWHAEALPAWPSGTELARGADPWPVIDPLPTALAATLGRLVGDIALAYNTWLLAGVALAFVGGALLARSQGGHPLVGGFALALAPAFVGSLNSGLTEDAAVGLGALGLALLLRGGGLRSALAAGLCLGLLAWCGLVVAWTFALAAVGLGLAQVCWPMDAAAPPLATRLRRLGLAGLLALLLAAPLLWVHGDRLLGEGHRAGTWVAQAEPLWRLNPWKGVDLASLLAPGRQDPGEALVRTHPGYLGLVGLALALAGGWSRWWLVLGACLAVAPGPWLSFAGEPLAANPVVSALSGLPGFSLLNHHGRVLILGAVALGVLAARGATRLSARFPSVHPGIWGALVALDLLTLSPLRLALDTAHITPPTIYSSCPDSGEPLAPSDPCVGLDELPPGPMLVLPAAGPGIHFQRPLLDQRVHRRPLLRSPNQPGLPPDLQRTPTGRWLGGLAFADEPPPDELELPADLAAIVVMEPFVDKAREGLGPPVRRTADGALWDVRRLRTP